MNGYRFDIVIETDIEMSDDLMVELSLEMRDAFLSLLKSRRISGKIRGDMDVSRCKVDGYIDGGHT